LIITQTAPLPPAPEQVKDKKKRSADPKKELKIEKKQSSKQKREEIRKQIEEKENLRLKESNQISRRSKRIKKTNPKYENAMSELKLKAQKSKGENATKK